MKELEYQFLGEVLPPSPSWDLKFLIIIIVGRNKYINFMADSANGQDGSPQVNYYRSPAFVLTMKNNLLTRLIQSL